MRKHLRGEGGARTALLLALICITGQVVGGCRREIVPLTSRRYVRLDALLPLHPAWSQITALENVQAGFSVPAREMTSGVPAFPTAFPFTQTTPENLANERQKRIKADAAEYLKQWTAFLTADNAQRLEREVQARQRHDDALNRQDLVQKTAALKLDAAKTTGKLDHEIYLLGFLEVDYGSQGRAFIGDSRRNAIANAAKTRDRITALKKQRDALSQQDFRAAASEQLQSVRAQRIADAASFRRRRESELAADLQGQVTNRQKQLAESSQAIGILGRNLPTQPPSQTGPPPAPPDMAAVSQIARAQADAAQGQQHTQEMIQRERLLAAIRLDTEKAVAQIAEREGWQMVPEGSPRAADATEAVAKSLRAQWQRSPTQ